MQFCSVPLQQSSGHDQVTAHKYRLSKVNMHSPISQGNQYLDILPSICMSQGCTKRQQFNCSTACNKKKKPKSNNNIKIHFNSLKITCRIILSISTSYENRPRSRSYKLQLIMFTPVGHIRKSSLSFTVVFETTGFGTLLIISSQ